MLGEKSRQLILQTVFPCVPLAQVVADTNISAIASQLESMSTGCSLNAPSEHPAEDPE